MPVSIKNIFAFIALSSVFSACGKKERELTPREIQQKADSIVRTRIDKLRQQAKDDLDKRLPIELKPKVDSLLKSSINNETVPVLPEDDTDSDTGNVNTPAVTKDTLRKH